jgi:transcriptional regulator with XRE-family HTH domain
MPRSLRVQPSYIDKVKLALRHSGFPSQRSLSEEVGFALATVSNFLTGKPVDYNTFEELCRRLSLDWREISDLNFKGSGKEQNTEIFKCDSAEQTLSFCYPSGAVPLGSPFYLERTPLEEQIYQEIRKPGALVRIKAPREMGKTSLLLRVLDNAKRQGCITVSLNLEQVDQAILSDLNQFLRWLCASTSRQLGLQSRLDEYWDEDLGCKLSCTTYFQEYLLKNISAPLILALDEVHQIFEHPQVAKDFLPLLRSWYEEAKTMPIWQRLRLIVVHSTDIYVPLQLNQSPFNVGLPIQLNPFSLEDVQQLAQRYGLDWSSGEEARQLMDMVGGHPALVHTAVYHLSRGEETLEQLLKNVPTATGIFSYHLQRQWVALQEQSELFIALESVLSSAHPVQLEPILTHKLSSMGLIKIEGGKSILSCQLYRRYFENLLSIKSVTNQNNSVSNPGALVV